MRIESMANNQVIIIKNNGTSVFTSYDTIIAKITKSGKVTLSSKYDFSRTTMKYLCRFLAVDSIKTVRIMIANKTYKVVKSL